MLDNAKNILKKYYGYDSFRKGQEKVICSILDGKDTFAVMPTGAGKSLCYQIPALLFEGLTLVISPLISLMKDQVDSLKNMDMPADYINSSLTPSEVSEKLQLAVQGNLKLLYVAPERLENQGFCELLRFVNISMVAIDEAHCVSQWGHDFRTSYRYIPKFIKMLSNRPIVTAFTATATDEVKEDIVELLNLKNPNVFVTGFDRENLKFTVIRGENKRDFILNYVSDNKDKVGIIYVATRKEVENIYIFLKSKGYAVGKYHAGLNEKERTKNQEDFIYDNINIIVATNAFGMGIDKSNVRYVIHYNLPKNMEAYYQEAGRAGRDGEDSECILLFSSQDILLQKFLIEQSIVSLDRRNNEYKKLQEMVDYCHTQRCLRKYILEYFGEQNVKDNCGNCSTCNDETELTDITLEAQKIFSCIYRMNERFGTNLIAQVLKGSKNKKVIELNFDKLSTYGIMNEYTIKEIRDIINVLIADDYLALVDGQFPIVKLKEKSVSVLKNKDKVFQKIRKKNEKVLEDNSLFEVLRGLRKQISEREKVPPYVIFPDTTLKEMSKYYPMDNDSLLHIKGVGEVKIKKYGDEFIEAIKNYVCDNKIEIKAIENKFTENKEQNEKVDIPSHVITLNMYKEGKSILDISKERDLKMITVQDHIIRCALEGLDVDLNDFIPKEYEEIIIDKIKVIGGEKLKPIKEALPKEIDYFAIKAVLCKYKEVI